MPANEVEHICHQLGMWNSEETESPETKWLPGAVGCQHTYVTESPPVLHSVHTLCIYSEQMEDTVRHPRQLRQFPKGQGVGKIGSGGQRDAGKSFIWVLQWPPTKNLGKYCWALNSVWLLNQVCLLICVRLDRLITKWRCLSPWCRYLLCES